MTNLKTKAGIVSFLALVASVLSAPRAQAQSLYYEPWKGKTVTAPIEIGALSGANFYGSEVNWSVLLTGAYLIAEDGWANDLDDRVWVEVEAGPSFFGVPNSIDSQTGLQWSTHVRWDFTYNEYWNFYALGGFGGYGLPRALGNGFTFRPRFGAGVQYQTKVALMFRAEISAEFIGAGIGFNF